MTPPFTSHNILLPDGTQTAPDKPLVAGSGCCTVALAALAAAFPDGPSGVSVADLGCLEGGYAVEFARTGYDVTGIEVRDENLVCANGVAAALALPNLRFIQGDVREVLPGQQFDAVFCCGLLYHLDWPVAFLKLLGQVTRRLLILNTHISLQAGHPEDVHQFGEGCDTRPGQVHEGRAGHWFEEVDGRWSSWGNRGSFWLAKDELIAVLGEAGFSEVTEHPDWRGPHQHDPYWRGGGAPLPFGSGGAFDDRVMFTATR